MSCLPPLGRTPPSVPTCGTGALEKIKDASLRELARTRSSKTASVLVMINVPEPKVRFEPIGRGGHSFPVPVPETPEEKAKAEKVAAQAKTFLKNVLGQEPLYIGLARTFSLSASGAQLCRIAESPLFKVIEPNRTYQIPVEPNL